MTIHKEEKPYEFSQNVQIENIYDDNYKVVIEGMSAETQHRLFSLLAQTALEKMAKESVGILTPPIFHINRKRRK